MPCLHRIDPARAFNISVRMGTCTLTDVGTEGKETGFTFPLVVDNNNTFEQFRATIFAKYPWGLHDAVELRYRDVSKVAWVHVQSDNELGAMFANNAQTMSCNLEITLIQRRRPPSGSENNSNPTASRPSGSKASAKPRTNTRGTSSSCRPPTTPSANAQSEHSCSKTQAKPSIPVDPVVEEAEPDAVPLSDEEDEKLYPGYTEHNMEEDKANESYIPAEFSDTDEDEQLEEKDNAEFGTDDEDIPVMMYDRENPSIEEGVVFPSAVECRNAVATFSITTETEYITLKSDQRRFTVKCASDRCKWRLHASLMRRSTLFQVLMHFLFSFL